MKILGISCYYHDSAAAMIVDGVPVAAAQEERFTRKKNDAAFPYFAIQYCLKQLHCALHEIDAIVFYDKPFWKLDRLLETYLAEFPYRWKTFAETFSSSLQKTIFLRHSITKALKNIDSHFDDSKLFFSEHHLSHAASAYFPSPFDSAVVLTMDGLGEWATTTVTLGNGNDLKIQKEIHFPHSLGLFYSTLTAFCGFKVNSGEYKLMGLAPYGRPRYAELLLNNVISLQRDGSFTLNLKYFNFSSTQKMHTPNLEKLLGMSPRSPESFIDTIHMDLAASTQQVLNLAVLGITKHLHETYNSPNLCMAGGVALNCVSNTEILKQGFFKNIWVQPAAGDAGGALGAAMALHSLHFKNKRDYQPKTDLMSAGLLGPEYKVDEIEKCLQKHSLVYRKLDEDSLITETVEALCVGQSVGWFQGRMEFGPRALGSRSILADPRNPEMQKRLNLQIKFRESFRPFAPVVLQEKFNDWFDGIFKESPYMLFVDRIQKKHQNEAPSNDSSLAIGCSTIPAVTHLDFSARVQTVTKEQNPLLHKLLTAFDMATGVPILINTSFNVRGEPIVESPQDAIQCFLKTDLDILLIGTLLVEKTKNIDKILTRKTMGDLD